MAGTILERVCSWFKAFTEFAKVHVAVVCASLDVSTAAGLMVDAPTDVVGFYPAVSFYHTRGIFWTHDLRRSGVSSPVY